MDEDSVLGLWSIVMAQQQMIFALVELLVESRALSPRQGARMLREAAATLKVQDIAGHEAPATQMKTVIENAAGRIERIVSWPIAEGGGQARSRLRSR